MLYKLDFSQKIFVLISKFDTPIKPMLNNK